MRLRLWLLAGLIAVAQAPPNIRVDVNLIQIDATVTDRDGKRVSDLQTSDFEVKRDGKRQKVQSVLWVPGQRVNQAPATAASTSQAAAGELRPENVRRTIGIMLDDFSLSPASMKFTRDAIRKLIQDDIDSQDLVAIYRASRGLSMLQQFTTNRNQLLASMDRLSFGAASAFDPQAPASAGMPDSNQDAALATKVEEMQLREEIANREITDIRTSAMLGAVTLAVRGLGELPGRKTLVLFSDGIQLFDAPAALTNPNMAPALTQMPGANGGKRSRTDAAARSLIDAANRAGVMIYTIDPRGLVSHGVMASDNIVSSDPRAAINLAARRSLDFSLSQDGMALLAEETGGRFYKNSNDITGSLRNALNDQEGYYLIAFQPDDATFERAKLGPKFQRLTIKVTRPGLSVRYRRSFYGVPEPAAQKTSLLASALVSPFLSSQVPIRLTPVYMHAEKAGSYLRTLLHVDASTLQFKTVPADAGDKNQDPWLQTMLKEVIVVFDETGRATDQMVNPQLIKVRGRDRELLLKQGFDQQIDLPVPRPGPYQVRAAVEDATSNRTGSAAQFIEIPDLKRNRLTLSSALLSSVAWAEGKDPAGSAAQRVVKKGSEMEYGVSVYNARRAAGGAGADLVTQLRLFRDGQLIFTGKKTPVAAEVQKSAEKVIISGRLRVNSPPGDYVLEIAVQDRAAPAKQQVAVRYIDYSVRD